VIFIVNTAKNLALYPVIPLQDKMVNPKELHVFLVHALLDAWLLSTFLVSHVTEGHYVFTKPLYLTLTQRFLIQTLFLTQSVYRIMLVVECAEMLVMTGIRLGLLQVKISKYVTGSGINWDSLLYSIAYLKVCDTDLSNSRSYLFTYSMDQSPS
jgi:hypothetical protein